jgi:DNA (cytosine-5)-methyltransferase 1
MNVLDLFSGIGGFSLGLERAGMRTVAFCEIDPYPRAVLAKNWPGVPCADDITAREFVPGEADVICGGFPCQDISTAGNGAGLAGERSGLWRELLRAIRVVRPRFAIVENVAALLSRGMGTVLGDMAEIGYDTEWHCIPASAVGAPHRRDRVWIIADARGEQYEGDSPPFSGALAEELFAANAYPDVHTGGLADREDPSTSARGESCNEGQGKTPHGERVWIEPGSSCPPLANANDQRELQPQGRERDQWGWVSDRGQDVAHAERIGCDEVVEPIACGAPGEGPANPTEHPGFAGGGQWWATEPDVGRVAHGIPARVDRLKGLGNAVVPQIPEIIGRAIMSRSTIPHDREADHG